MTRNVSSRSHHPLALAITLALAASGGQASTITVNSSDDTAMSTFCNLRNAIASINAAAVQPTCVGSTTGTFGTSDTIVFAPSVANSTISMAQGEFILTAPVIITGSGQTLDAHFGNYRVMSSSKDLSLSDLTLSGGTTSAPGGGLYVTTATSSGVSLSNVTLSNNAASTGGGLYSKGSVDLLMQNSVITGNKCSTGAGGALLRDATATIIGSRISGNNSNGRTGGILFGGETANVHHSVIDGNSAACGTNYCSGGVYIAGGSVSIGYSTISNNSANGATYSHSYVAGGVYTFTSTATIFNSTITGNSASGVDDVGGAISEGNYDGPYGLTLTNTTVSGNSASTPTATPTLISGGMIVGAYYGGNTNSANSIISGNTATIGANAAAASDVASGSSAPSLAFHFSLLGAALSATFTGNSNVFNDTPGLGPLASNGGPTKTMALLAGSPAINAGNNGDAVDAHLSPLILDQAGGPRINSTTVDIGAFEFIGDRIFANGFE